MRHFATTRDRPALVALLHRTGPAFTDVVAATCRTPPLLDFTAPDGLEQTVWRVADGPDTDTLTEELGGDAHYIADGHHRVAASLEEWRTAGKPPDAGVLCVVYPLDGLNLSAFHRRVVGPVDRPACWSCSRRSSTCWETAAPPALATGRFGVYAARTWLAATFRGDRPDGASGLDVSVLHAAVIGELVHGADTVPNVEFAPAGRELDGADRTLRPRRRCAVHAGPARSRRTHGARRPRRGDAAEDDVLRAEALRGHLPAFVGGADVVSAQLRRNDRTRSTGRVPRTRTSGALRQLSVLHRGARRWSS